MSAVFERLSEPVIGSDTEAYRPPLPETAIEIAAAGATVGPEATNHAVFQLFSERQDLANLVVVSAGAPIGLINRSVFMGNFAKPFHRELYARKSCTLAMDRKPLLVDAAVPLHEIGTTAVEAGDKVLAQGFVVTRAGTYAGVCDGMTLLRTLSALQEEQHRELLSSIEYASTIQRAMLTNSLNCMREKLGAKQFLIWEPRDVVGGDCYFAAASEGRLIVALLDCTGHGVPGAFLTVIAESEFGRIVAEHGQNEPGELLGMLNRRMKAALYQDDAAGAENQSDDGLDASVICFDQRTATLQYAGAKLPLFVRTAQGEIQTLKGDRKGVGYRDTPADYAWTTQTLPVAPGQRVFAATDGLSDQIGEAKPIAFGWNRFKQRIDASSNRTLTEQGEQLWRDFLAYQGQQARRDDVTVLGMALTEDFLSQAAH